MIVQFICAGAIAFCLSGCVNGQLSPVVAPVVSVLDGTACAVAALLVAGTPVGEVCTEVADEVNKILQGLSAQVAARKLTAAQASAPRKPIKYKGVFVGHIDADLYDAAQALLDAAS